MDSDDLDPIQKQTMKCKRRFGQCPKQLFTADHPRRDEKPASDGSGVGLGAEPKETGGGEVQVAATSNAAEEAAAAAKAEEDAKNAAIEEARRRWHEKQRLEAEATRKAEEARAKANVLAEEQQKRDARTKAAAGARGIKRVPNEATSTRADAEKPAAILATH